MQLLLKLVEQLGKLKISNFIVYLFVQKQFVKSL